MKKISSKMEVAPPPKLLKLLSLLPLLTLLTLLTQWHMPTYIATWLRLWSGMGAKQYGK